MTAMDIAQAWARILPGASWFEGGHRRPQRLKVTLSDWATEPGTWPAVREEELTVTYADGTAEAYRLISAYRPVAASVPAVTLAVVELDDLGEVALSDAMTDPEAFGAYLDQLGVGIHPGVERDDVVVLERRPGTARVRIGRNAVFTLYRTAGFAQESAPKGPRVFSEFFSADNRLIATIVESFADDTQRIPLGFGAPA